MSFKRHLKRAMTLLICFLCLELGGLIYLNNYYLVDRNSLDISTSDVDSADQAANAKNQADLPQDAKSFQYSDDAGYIGYLLDGKIQIVSMSDGSKETISPESKSSISFFKFVQSRDRLIIAEKNSSQSFINLYYYDIANKNKAEIFNKDSNSAVKISLIGKSEDVTDLQMSPLTNLIYIKFTDSSKKSRIYCLNIMAQGSKVNLSCSHIGTVNLVYGDDILYYENSDSGKIYTKGKNNALKVDGNTSFSIVGSDSSNKLYIAEMKSGKTNCVYYGSEKGGWTKKSLGKSVGLADVAVDFSGDIYVNDESGKTLDNVSDGKSVKYQGNLLGITSSGYLTEADNTVRYTAF